MAIGLSAGPTAPTALGLSRGLDLFLWLLPLHIAIMAVLFGYVGVPGPTMRVVAAWKEVLVLALAAITVGRALTGRGPRAAVHMLDLAVAALLFYAVWFLVGGRGLYGQGSLPSGAGLYGLRDAALFLLLYFVGRATPSVAQSDRILRTFVAAGVVTSIIAVLERLFASPDTLVVLGAARYFREFLGVALATASNEYGLPDNYWTIIGDHLVRRVGSTYLSSQGFAIPFLVIMPAATLWITGVRRRQAVAWGAYALLWIALLLTLTRMTIVACVLQTVLIAGLRRRWSLPLNIGTAAVTAVAVATVLFPGALVFAWNTLTWQSASSASHVADWQGGIVNMLEHPLGAGLGTADQVAMRFGLDPLAYDNQYLTYGVELGIPGLALFLAVLAGGVAAGVRAWRSAAEPVRSYGILIAVTGLGILWNAVTAAVFNSMVLSYAFFWLVGSVITASDQAATATSP
jgi:hypothetical protein